MTFRQVKIVFERYMRANPCSFYSMCCLLSIPTMCFLPIHTHVSKQFKILDFIFLYATFHIIHIITQTAKINAEILNAKCFRKIWEIKQFRYDKLPDSVHKACDFWKNICMCLDLSLTSLVQWDLWFLSPVQVMLQASHFGITPIQKQLCCHKL